MGEDFDIEIDENTLRQIIRIVIDEYTQGSPLQLGDIPQAFAYVERRLRRILPEWEKLCDDPDFISQLRAGDGASGR